MKKLFTILAVITLSGCATHANITMPTVTQVTDKAYENKTISYEVMYSQPKPGVFSEGNQLPLKPLKAAELSVASATTLKKLPNYILQQLPVSTETAAKGQGDLNLKIELYAHDKKGPAYAEYEMAKSLGKSLLTLGLGSSEYEIIADFDATYTLMQGHKEVFSKKYKVKDHADHERNQFEGFNGLNEYAGQMLEKHLVLTLNDFFKQAANKL